MVKTRKAISIFLAVIMLIAMSITGFAADGSTGFNDVADGAWYADAVKYVNENNLMSGTGNNNFEPQTNTSRVMLAAILYRYAGSPAADSSADFNDVVAGAYYEDAVKWASANGIVSGYGDGVFGVNDSVTREQTAAILWRYSGSPQAEAGQAFTDAASISEYAVSAVNWARANGIVNGLEDNSFNPKGTATRAQTATILRNYITYVSDNNSENNDQPGTDTSSDTQTPGITDNPAVTPENPSASDDTAQTGKTLVVYFSGTGNTKAAAELIAKVENADIKELEAVEPYTSSDLNYNDSSSRVSREHADASLQDVQLVADTIENWSSYDRVYIGYPIWWGGAAWPINDFVKSNDFTGKTVIPFCTSGSSGIGSSGTALAAMAGTGNWLSGQRFSGSVSETEISQWISGMERR